MPGLFAEERKQAGRVSFASFAQPEAIDTVITDAITDADRARLEESGIDVLVAG